MDLVNLLLQLDYFESQLVGLLGLSHVTLTSLGQFLVLRSQELVVLLQHVDLLLVVTVHLHAQLLRPVQGV